MKKVLFLTGLIACSDVSSIAYTTPAESTPATSVIEQSSRELDLGKNASPTKAALVELLVRPDLARSDRDDATLLLARAYDHAGEKELALSTLEKLLAEREHDSNFRRSNDASRLLKKILTGIESDSSPRSDEEETIAPSAKWLADYYPTKKGENTRVNLVSIRGDRRRTESLGTFAIQAAIRERELKACPLCDPPSLGTDDSNFGSWTAIVANKERIGHATTIVYFDLADGKVPSRYDSVLAMPSDEIVRRIEGGDGLIVAKDRPGAPPLIVIAAPRIGQLPAVEAKFAMLTSLPKEPVVVKLDPHLTSKEIQRVVLGRRGALLDCYFAFVDGHPHSAADVKMAFSIQPDGQVSGVSAELDDGLKDPTFQRCLTDKAKKFVFPAIHSDGNTTVRYPIKFTPGK